MVLPNKASPRASVEIVIFVILSIVDFVDGRKSRLVSISNGDDASVLKCSVILEDRESLNAAANQREAHKM